MQKKLEIESTVYRSIFLKEVNNNWSFHVSEDYCARSLFFTGESLFFIFHGLSFRFRRIVANSYLTD